MSIPRRHIPLLAGLIACVLLYAAVSLRYSQQGFFNTQVAINFLVDQSFLGIIAVGMTFVILSGGIDLSVGAVMSLASVLIAVLVMKFHWPPLLAMSAAMVLGSCLGAGMGSIIHFVGIQPFIVTLAGMFFARGLGFLVHLESIAINYPQQTQLADLAIPLGHSAYLSITGVVFLAVVLIGVYVSVFTSFGRNVYALGGNENAALLMGLPIGRTKIGVYAVSGFCSALAGAVLTLYLTSGNPSAGVGLELNAIAVVVIGGTLLTGGVGSVFGTLIGTLIIAIIMTVITYEPRITGAGSTKVAIGALLLVFVLLQRLIVWRGIRKS